MDQKNIKILLILKKYNIIKNIILKNLLKNEK